MAKTNKQDAGEKQAAKYRERDERIMDRLRSFDAAERNAGMDELERTHRKPLNKVLRAIAVGATSPAYKTILDEHLNVDPDAFDEIWQHTSVCVYENVQKENFEFKGYLLAYLVKIALRRIITQWRWERKHEQPTDTDFENLANHQDDMFQKFERRELLWQISQFAKTLDENDCIVLEIGVQYAVAGHGVSENIENIRRSGAWDGSLGTLTRRYHRLRSELREFLRKRGYDV